MSRFRGYDNAANRKNVRIDARPRNDEATQAGMRGVHRNMRGDVVGGYTAEGGAIGTKSKFRQMGGGMSRLDAGPQTPGLDRQAAMQKAAPTTVDSPAAPMPAAPMDAARGANLVNAPGTGSFADQDRAARERSAASGAFGKGAQNMAGRQSLFRDMTNMTNMAANGQMPIDAAARAKKLGVAPNRFRSAVAAMGPQPNAFATTLTEANKAFPVGPKIKRPS